MQRRRDGGNAAPVAQLSQRPKLTEFHKLKLMHVTQKCSLVLREVRPDDGGMAALLSRFRVDLLLLEDANFVEKGLLERWRGDGVLKQEESTGGRREEVESFF